MNNPSASNHSDTINAPRVKAAKRAANALQSDLDFALYLDAHPNEDNALARLWSDIQDATGEAA